MKAKTFKYCNEVYEAYADEDLVKVAEMGDYETALEDYKKECEDDSVTMEEFLERMQNASIRYCERADGIYYINDWAG